MTSRNLAITLAAVLVSSGLGCGEEATPGAVDTGVAGDGGSGDAPGDGPAAPDGGSASQDAPAGTDVMAQDAAGYAGPGADGGTDAGSLDMSADAAPAAIVQADFPFALATAYCRLIGSCCAPKGTLRADCVAFHRAQAQQVLDALTPTQRYDATAAAACIAALQSSPLDCRPDFDWVNAFRRQCAMVVRGIRAPGEACAGPQDCRLADGGIGNRDTGFVGCAEYGGVATKRCRVFRPTTQVGAECEHGFGGTATEVDVCGGELRCESGKCASPPPALDPGATCDPASRCRDGYCSESTARCTSFAGTGAACQGGRCAPLQLCVESANVCLFVVPSPQIGFGGLEHWQSCTFP